MTYLKLYGKKIFFTILEILLCLFILSLLYYFNLIQEKTYSILKIICLLGSIFINSFLLGKSTIKKGYLEGIKYGLLLVLICLIPTLFLQQFQLKILIYYFLILSTSTLGSMVGISRKKK